MILVCIPCVLSSELILIVLCIDDLLIAGNKRADIDRIKEVQERIEMKDMGEFKQLLGLEINSNRFNRSLFLHQTKYTENIFERFCMKKSRPASTTL